MSKRNPPEESCPQHTVCDLRFDQIAKAIAALHQDVKALDANVRNGITKKITDVEKDVATVKAQTSFQWWLLGGLIVCVTVVAWALITGLGVK